MKKILISVFVAIASVLMMGCGGDNPDPNNNLAGTLDIVGTSWRGVCNTTYQHPEYGDLPATLTWTIDVEEEKLSFFVELVLGGQEQPNSSFDTPYTYANNQGLIISPDDPTDTEPFYIDPINRTLKTELYILAGTSQEDAIAIGGEVTLHQIY